MKRLLLVALIFGLVNQVWSQQSCADCTIKVPTLPDPETVGDTTIFEFESTGNRANCFSGAINPRWSVTGDAVITGGVDPITLKAYGDYELTLTYDQTNGTLDQTCTLDIGANIATNPVFNIDCGLDVVLVLDESNSISPTEEIGVRNAIFGFLDALKGTGSHISFVEFATVAEAEALSCGEPGSPNYVEVTDANIAGCLSTYINTDYGIASGGGATNWDDGLLKVQDVINNNNIQPDIVVFFTDGNPTYYMDESNGGILAGAGSVLTSEAITHATVQANVVKQFTHMFAIGVGTGLNEENLKMITGIQENNGDIINSDYEIAPNFSDLNECFRNVALAACGTEVSIDKTGPECVSANNLTIEYVIEVNNDGVNPARGLNIIDELPAGYILNSSVRNPNVGSVSNIGNTYTWDFGTTNLAMGTAATWTLNVTIPANSGVNTNYAYVDGSNILADGDDTSSVVTAFNDLDINGSITNNSCSASSIGAIDLTLNGGTTPYTFDWSNGATTEDIAGLTAGTYQVVVTDGSGCEDSVEFTITDIDDLSISSTKTDVLCFGDEIGAIDLSVTGGNQPYTYAWTNGDTTQDVGDLAAGVYNVTVTDVNGCSESFTTGISISEPDVISVVITKENATTSQGCANGTATATPSGGTPPYTYLWSASAGSQTAQTATNLSQTTHTVFITDANDCVLEQGVVIDCSNTCDAVVDVDTVIDVLCTSELTGATTVSASSDANANATFTFTWNTVPAQIDAGVTTSTLSGVGAGVYTVSVTIDGTVCLAVEQSVTIIEPSNALSVSTSSTDESGPSTGDGTATANATGGVPPYTYSWSPGGATTQTITGLSAGSYIVTVTDTNGCTEVSTATVNPGSCLNLAVSTSSTAVTCNGDSDGTATAIVSGGSGAGNITYLWSNGATTSSISGLSGGNYSVTVTDGVTACTSQSSTTVNEPNELTSGIAVSNILCFEEATGSLDLTVSGGTFPYTFLWSNGATTEDLDFLVAGTYNVTITDVNGCVATNEATVNQPSAGLEVSSSQTDILCFGEATGEIDLTVTGGTEPYTYTWTNDASTQDISGLIAGTYNVTVLDANGCMESFTTGINLTEPEVISVVITKENATTSQGCSNGEATATPSGGTPPYTYLWSASAGSQTTQTATNLPQATHTVAITDANGCVLEQGVVIDCSNTCDAVVAVDDVVDVFCTGDLSGSTTVSASSDANSTATFTFTWNTVPAQIDAGVTTSTLSGVGAGVYTVSVTIDGTVCLAVEQSVTIVEPSNALSVSTSSTDESGPNTGDGTATANVLGGVIPYEYSWSPGGATTQTITDLSAGSYIVTVTDSNGCTAMATAIVNPGSCLNLAVSTSSTPVTCNGDSDGTVTAIVTGGSGAGNVTYLWNNGATSSSINGLAGGNYSVTVTDGVTACTAQSSSTVNEPNELTSGIAVSNILCFEEATGSLDLTVSGGTFPYTFLWSNGATSEDLINLVAGTYSVTITDVNGCVATNEATINQPNAGLELSSSQTNVLCFGDATGAIDITVAGGTEPYTYTWTNGETTEDISGLIAGTYNVTVLDANGCTITLTTAITQPDALEISGLTSVDATCNGFTNGNVNITVTGGNQPYTFDWSNGAITEDLSNIGAGAYNVVVTDANGCTTTLQSSVEISEPDALEITLGNVTNASCNGFENGSIDISVSGGTTDYTYLWSNGATTQDISDLGAGSYNVVVTDANGCTATLPNDIEITEAGELTITVENTSNVSCNGLADGSIDISIDAGTPPYDIQWNNGATTEDITGLVAGNYNVMVTDANGCQANIPGGVTITQPDELTVSVTNSINVSCNGFTDGSIDVTVSGGTEAYTFEWSNGATTEDLSNVGAGTYNVIITDANGCTATLQTALEISQPNELTISVNTSSNASCNGFTDGSIDVTVSGGTEAYTFEWSNGATTEDLSNVGAGSYTVTVTDANGCTATLQSTLEITEPDELTIAVNTSSNVSCNGFTDGSIDITVSGGTEAYTYEWSNGAITEDLSNVGAGSYTVTVTDANGCSATFQTAIDITEPDELTIAIEAVENASCNGGTDGSIDISVAGGTEPYTYDWSNGATSEDINNLGAGNYNVVVTDANGCTTTLQNGIDITEAGELTITVENTSDASCNGFTDGSIDITVSAGTPPYTYEWSNGATTEDISDLNAGNYNVTVTDANGCVATIPNGVQISEPDALTITTNNINDASCFGFSDGSIDVTVSGGTEPYTFNWDNGATTEDLSDVGIGTYILSVTDDNGCTATSTNEVDEPELVSLVIFIDEDTNSICEGSSIQINGPAGFADYQWYFNNQPIPSGTQQNIIVDEAGSYYLQVEDQGGCASANSNPIEIEIFETQEIDIALAGDAFICETDSLTLTATAGFADYDWFLDGVEIVNENQNTIVVTEEGVYTVAATDNNGCFSATDDFVNLTVGENPAPTITQSSNTLCPFGGLIELTTEAGFATYEWTFDGVVIPGATTNEISVSEEGNYQVTVTNDDGCSGTASIDVTFTVVPVNVDTVYAEVVMLESTEICLEDELDLLGDIATVTICQEPTMVTYEFENLGSSLCFTIDRNSNDPGMDTICVITCDTSECGICDTTIIVLDLNDLDDPPIATEECVELFEDEELSVDVLANDIDPDGDVLVITNIIVEPGNGETIIEGGGQSILYIPEEGFCGLDTIYYEVCDEDLNGCDTSFVCIEVLCECFVPNVLTPNGDNMNDVFEVECLEKIDGAVLRVFNRWGNEVYRSENYKNDWNGYYDGKPLPEGTYYFVIDFVDLRGEQINVAGDLTILR